MQTEFVRVAGGTLAITDYGNGSRGNDPVIMVPGMGALRCEYRFLAPQIHAAGFRSITVDIRGHGESSVPWDTYDVPSVGRDILAIAEYTGAGAVHLIGTSKSAGAVVWAAAEAPERVTSIVLIGPFARDVPVSPVMKLMMWLVMKNPWKVASWLSYYKTLYPTRTPDDFPHYIATLRSSLREKGRMDAAYRYGAASLAESDSRLRKLTIPTLIVMGTRDPDYSDASAEARAIGKMCGGEVRLIDGAGHYPQTEMPEETNPSISRFISQHASKEAVL